MAGDIKPTASRIDLVSRSEPGEGGEEDRQHAAIDEEFYPWADEDE